MMCFFVPPAAARKLGRCVEVQLHCRGKFPTCCAAVPKRKKNQEQTRQMTVHAVYRHFTVLSVSSKEEADRFEHVESLSSSAPPANCGCNPACSELVMRNGNKGLFFLFSTSISHTVPIMGPSPFCCLLSSFLFLFCWFCSVALGAAGVAWPTEVFGPAPRHKTWRVFASG